VGVTGVQKVIRGRSNGAERLFYADVECFVDLGPQEKGAHVALNQFTFSFSIVILTMVVLGGMGSIWGVVVGAIIVSAINTWLLPRVLHDVPGKMGLEFDPSEISAGDKRPEEADAIDDLRAPIATRA
jgi:hypothetical protein